MFDDIVVPLDGSSLAECVLPHIAAIAQPFGSQVSLLRVLDHSSRNGASRAIDALDWSIALAEAEAYLAEWTDRLQGEASLHTEHHIIEGRPAEQVIEFARHSRDSLMLLNSHGQGGLTAWSLGSTVQNIVQRAYTSVMIVRAEQPCHDNLGGLRYRRLLVPLDCSLRGEYALSAAVNLARFHGAQLLLATVVSKPEIPRRRPLTQEEAELTDQITELNMIDAAKYLAELRSRLDTEDIDVQGRMLVTDGAVEALHNLVLEEKIDLVVMSAHGFHGGTKWPYGSVAVSFIAYGTTSLLVVQDLVPGELEPTQAELAAKVSRGRDGSAERSS